MHNPAANQVLQGRCPAERCARPLLPWAVQRAFDRSSRARAVIALLVAVVAFAPAND
jgi:hypothetical protein